MREIHLSQDYVALVDDERYESVMQFKWRALVDRRKDGSIRNVYAVRVETLGGGTRKLVYLHRFLIGAIPGEHCDHINGDGLDNRMTNLRICTNAENHRNQRIRIGCSSKHKGVCWHKQRGKWQAEIKINGMGRHLGLFSDETDAARAYDVAAAELFGEFARLNEYTQTAVDIHTAL